MSRSHASIAPSRAAERAFTLLEMMVVLVIIGVASAVVFPSIGGMMQSSTRGVALSHATGEAKAAFRLFESDVRAARGARSTGGRDDLRSDTSASTVDALNSTSPERHDLLEIGPTRLVIVADVNGNRSWGPPESLSVERVTWELLQNTDACGGRNPAGRNWCVVRGTRALEPDGSDGPYVTSEIVTAGIGPFPANDMCMRDGVDRVMLFCYQTSTPTGGYVWNGGWTSECSRTWGSASRTLSPSKTYGPTRWIGNVRHSNFGGAVTLHTLDTITGVRAAIPAGNGYGNSHERLFKSGLATIRSRSGADYQQAIMCGAR